MTRNADTMSILIISLLLQATWAQQAEPFDFYKIFNALAQRDVFSNSGNFNFNVDDVFPSPYENLAEQQLNYQNAAAQLQFIPSDFYNNGYPFGFVPLNVQLDPDLTLFLAFCRLPPIQTPTCCIPMNNPTRPRPGPAGGPYSTSPSPITPRPTSDQTSSFVTSSPTSQPASSSTAPPPRTDAPTTRPTTKATTQQASSAATPTTEGPDEVTGRIGDPDDDEVATTTEEQYLPLDFAIATPDLPPA